MTLRYQVTILALTVLLGNSAIAQTAPANSNANARGAWEYALTVDGYIVPDEDGYVSPTLAADRGWLHVEGRYNYEDLRTGWLWFGYNFSAGSKLVFSVTPMIGGVFGSANGIAPGFEASLSYKKLDLSMSNEYVFATGSKASNFYYAWPELSYSPLGWLRIGLVAQRTKTYHTSLDTQRGFLVGITHKKLEITAYIFNLGWTTPTAVLEANVSF
jgi:hypothetical protein